MPNTLVELLGTRAESQPEKIAYTFLLDGETDVATLTYGELDQQARAIGALLQSLSLCWGDCGTCLSADVAAVHAAAMVHCQRRLPASGAHYHSHSVKPYASIRLT